MKKTLRRFTVLFIGALALVVTLSSVLIAQQAAALQGSVTDARSGQVLPGANVFIKELQLGAAADRDGNYNFLVPAGLVQGQQVTLIVKFVGYKQTIETITLSPGLLKRDFALTEDVLGMQEVVVTGQGQQVELRQLGASIGSIDAGQYREAPVVSISQLLQAREAGVTVQQGSGAVGQASRIMLRGPISLSMGVQPVIYIDGMRIDNSTTTGAWTGGGTWQSMDDINWADVERVEIVKGAAAATLYGTQAASGVIQLFTHRARDPRPVSWTYSNMMGYNILPKDPLSKISVYSDWFKDKVARDGFYQNHNLSAQGMVGAFQYYTSGTYRKNEGPYPNNNEYYYSLRGNIQFLPREDLVMRLNTSYSDRKLDMPQDGNNIFSYLVNGLLGGPRGAFTPVDSIPRVGVALTSRRFQSTLTSEYTPFQFFSTRATVGVDVSHFDNIEHRPFGVLSGTPLGYKYNMRRASDLRTVDVAGTLTLNPFENLNSTTSFGFQGIEDTRSWMWASGRDFPVPGLKTLGAAAVKDGSEWRFESKEYGFYVQQRFGFHDLVYLTGGFRTDRHASFGVDYGWGFYPSVGISYVISDHGFWPDWLGELRLRAQYGAAGQPPGSYDAMRIWSPITGIAGVPAVTTARVGDRKLGAEVSNEFEGGFDLGILEQRITLAATYYNQRTTDALLPVRLPPSLGFLDLQNMNVAEVSNQGLELSLKARLLELSFLRWGAGVNFSYNKNEILDMADVPETTIQWAQKNKKGFPVGGFHANRIELGPDGKLFINKGVDGLGVYIGPGYPVRTIQINMDVTLFKNIRLNALVDHQGGHYTESGTFSVITGRLIGKDDPIFPDQADRPVAPWARKIYDERDKLPDADKGDPLKYSDPVMAAYVLNIAVDGLRRPWGNRVLKADFWRLREATVTYTIPSDWIRSFGLTSAAVYLSGRNLWFTHDALTMDTETNYNTGAEYTTQDFFVAPLLRQYYFGIRVSF